MRSKQTVFGLGASQLLGTMGQIADYMCLDGTIPVNKLPYVLKCIGEMSKTYGLSVANVFHAATVICIHSSFTMQEAWRID